MAPFQFSFLFPVTVVHHRTVDCGVRRDGLFKASSFLRAGVICGVSDCVVDPGFRTTNSSALTELGVVCQAAYVTSL